MMKQTKRVWWFFNLWEADAFEQYLEKMATQGWFLESVGGSVMKFHRAEEIVDEVRNASLDLADLKYEVLKIVGDAYGNN